MQKDAAILKEAGVQVAAISYDGVSILSDFSKSGKVKFPLLSDPGSRTMEDFGIRNKKVKGSRIDGVPHPGTFIVGEDGVIKAKLFFDGYRERHQAKDIAAAISKASQTN